MGSTIRFRCPIAVNISLEKFDHLGMNIEVWAFAELLATTLLQKAIVSWPCGRVDD